MNPIIFALMFIGIFMMIYGIYEEKIKYLKQTQKTKYKFVPRTYYEEQIFNKNFDTKIESIYKNIDKRKEHLDVENIVTRPDTKRSIQDILNLQTTPDIQDITSATTVI